MNLRGMLATTLAVFGILFATSTPVSATPNVATTCRDGMILKFGQSCKFRGVSTTVSRSKYTPSRTSPCSKVRYTRAYAIKVTNASTRIAQAFSWVDSLSDVGQTTICIDSKQGLWGVPRDEAVLPGRSRSFLVAYGYQSQKGVFVELNVSYLDPGGPTIYWH